MTKNEILCVSAPLREKYQTARISRLMAVAKKEKFRIQPFAV